MRARAKRFVREAGDFVAASARRFLRGRGATGSAALGAAVALSLASCSDPLDDTVFGVGETGGMGPGGVSPFSGGGGSGGEQTIKSGSGVVWCDTGARTGRRLARDISVDKISVYQGVEVPVVLGGEPVARRNADVVLGRDALVRIFVSPGSAYVGKRLVARFVVRDDDEQETVWEDARQIRSASADVDLDSTFNFYLPGGELLRDRDYAVELIEEGICDAPGSVALPRFPATGVEPLDVRATGPVKIVIVPVRYDADGSGRLPDLGEEHLEELHSFLDAVFPASRVELSVRSEVGTTEVTLGGMLNQLMQLREFDEPSDDVTYFGLVNPATTMNEYCVGGCVAGVATFGATDGRAGVGVGVGFREFARETFVHELGHVHRLLHAPCGGPTGPDPDFPYVDADIGTWGYDRRTHTLIDPTSSHRDLMSYCDPTWISDYNFQNLIERISLVNGLSRSDEVLPAEPRVFRVLLVDPDGGTRWGLPIALRRRPPGEPVQADILDAAGDAIDRVIVFRRDLSEGQGALYLVPQPQARWHRVQVPGAPAHAFSKPPSIPAFVP